jgi:uncharacterized membrane protein
MKRIFTWFLQGLLFVAPLFVTGYVVYKLFVSIDGLFSTYIEEYFGYNVPGMGILFMFLSLVLLGIIGGTILGRPIRRFINEVLERLPFFKLIYTSVNDLFSAFVGKERKFHRPVLVLLNKENNIWKIGFVTQDTPIDTGFEDLVTVYFPYSYAMSGEIFFVPASNIKPISMKPTDAMKFIISGGVSGGTRSLLD